VFAPKDFSAYSIVSFKEITVLRGRLLTLLKHIRLVQKFAGSKRSSLFCHSVNDDEKSLKILTPVQRLYSGKRKTMKKKKFFNQKIYLPWNKFCSNQAQG
jgi:hypothetical protein